MTLSGLGICREAGKVAQVAGKRDHLDTPRIQKRSSPSLSTSANCARGKRRSRLMRSERSAKPTIRPPFIEPRRKSFELRRLLLN